ncbi:dTDP-4-dehydrorhamnose 3,5-epimerase [Endozoicomonas sp. SM1973]|uniref:dTDP-4-dehydrorhamnose 3,5-epimerase n=1 Tax=Spartinivicinus marinus TaxID=2994442 RepID=A0A853I941_9GAMM|nr:dTDP-4-dehydrorhamnose 3,5-epimerase [Spartinivicinus marinus]MCX4026101.1 dTDP-4-dehydrorhamnose 3,5-epimerase [Spartinivicinus marinus]NYZ66584.1 dTDP-4-dehydrorhamnose 3,5-epimerase [Spartinivicinus marinus]
MNIQKTNLPEVLEITPKVFSDSRGYFLETYHQSRYTTNGVPAQFLQDNRSHSTYGVLRGLHYQLKFPQAKLVRVTRGVVFDVAVDIRIGSPNFGQWTGVTLSESNNKQLYIPEGFAHGFIVLSKEADFEYKCSDFYHPNDEYGIIWNDPTINIQWPEVEKLNISNKDCSLPTLNQANTELLPKYEPN